MEAAVERLAEATGVRAVLGRLSNVYGPGQTLGKPQGLLSQLCLADATGRPLPVFVSMDTIRDYLYAGDAARMVVRSIALAAGSRPARSSPRCSPRAARSPSATSSPRRAGCSTARCAPSRSAAPGPGRCSTCAWSRRVWPEVDALAATPLPAGLARTSADVRARVVSGGPLDG